MTETDYTTLVDEYLEDEFQSHLKLAPAVCFHTTLNLDDFDEISFQFNMDNCIDIKPTIQTRTTQDFIKSNKAKKKQKSLL